jgi:outer membrane protein TolC
VGTAEESALRIPTHNTGLLAPACSILLALAGCQSQPSPGPVRPEISIADAIGVPGEAIAFTTVGGPDDAPASSSEFLALADAIRLALQNSPELQAALARVRGAEAEASQARLLPNPILNVALRFSTTTGTPDVDAGLAQELIAILRRPGRARVADARLRAAAADAVTAALEVVGNVRERYTGVQSLDALFAVLEERRRLVNRLLELARARQAAGEGTPLDVLTLQAQWVELDTEISDRELERRSQRLALSRLIGQPSGAADWAVSPWSPPGRAAAESEWVAAALERRPEVQAKQWELAAREQELAQTRFVPWDDTSVGVAAERQGGWSVGPSLNMPLPVFDVGQARRAAAEAALAGARHDLTQARRAVIEEVRQAHATLLASQGNLDRVRNELIPLQQRRLDQAEAQYRAGQTDLTTLFLAEQELRAARAKQVELERRTSESLIRLQRAVGGPGVAASRNLAGPTTAPAAPPATRSTAARQPQDVEPDDRVGDAAEARTRVKHHD